MPSVQVRDLPDPIYRKLVERARQEHRSLSQQVTFLLERALNASVEPRERRRRLLEQIRERPLVRKGRLRAPELLIREDRDR